MKKKIIISVLLILFAFSSAYFVTGQEQCPGINGRIDCHLNSTSIATEAACLAKGCLWCPISSPVVHNPPQCVTPKNYGYKLTTATNTSDENGVITFANYLTKADTGVTYNFGEEIQNIVVEFIYESNYRLRIKITDADDPTRFQVPLIVSPPKAPPTISLYEVETATSGDEIFWFKIKRSLTGETIFDGTLGGLTFCNQFIQFSTRLPSDSTSYGFGENEQTRFAHSFQNYSTFPMFARSQFPDGLKNLYGVQPYYTVLERDGSTHSVMIVNSNAQEVVLVPEPGLVYRTIGGIIDMYIFMGPAPEDTAQQFTEAVGRQNIPPYWGLGFQLSRWGYNHIDVMKETVARNRQHGIPQDVQYGDIDIMERWLDFTYDKDSFAGLPEYIQELKGNGIKFVTILDPGISSTQLDGEYAPYDSGNDMNVWITRPDGTPMLGSVWPGLVHFVDFSKPNATTWWVNHTVEFHKEIEFDGLWIDMNEPAIWADGDIDQPGCDISNKLNYPPYVPAIFGDHLFNKTACPDHVQDFGLHYNTHSLYGWSQSEPTLKAVRAATGKRSIVLSRSTFLGSGKWAAHWLGDNFSTWSNLHYSIIGILQFNHFGIPYVGADICGFFDDATEELATRWHQLGAFYPFARNHNINHTIAQDPAVWSQASIDSTKKALAVRYTLLPYFYTCFYLHATQGSTVVRALWHEFPDDQIARFVDTQFLWGSGVMIVPILEEGANARDVYLPDARWYDYYSGREFPARKEAIVKIIPNDTIDVYMRGGGIYPTQVPAINTVQSRANPFGLLIALDDSQKASGRLFYDDGDSIDPVTNGIYFYATFETEVICTADKVLQNKPRASKCWQLVKNTIEYDGYPVMSTKYLDSIRIFGIAKVFDVKINGLNHTSYTFDEDTRVLMVNNIGLQVQMTREFEILVETEPEPEVTTEAETEAPSDPTTTESNGIMFVPGHLIILAMFSFCFRIGNE